MQLKQLLQVLESQRAQGNPSDITAKGLTQDSRKVEKGYVFVAIRGFKSDGHTFLQQVVDAGADALVVEDLSQVPSRFKGPVYKVTDAREALDKLASQYYSHPSSELFVSGVTGTNGKTTTSLMVEALLNAAGKPCAVMGTIDFHFGENKVASTHTTPDALEIQRLLRGWKNSGAEALSMEVSSHALHLKRADSVEFDVGIFTNLTRDHMDLHSTMEEYAAAKGRLFFELLPKSKKKNKLAILNKEDPWFKKMLNNANKNWLFGFEDGDLAASQLDMSWEGTRCKIKSPLGHGELFLKMVGKHNVLNALGALGVGLHAGMDLSKALETLGRLKGVRGRLEAVDNNQGCHVFVDYAHTHDALENVLKFLNALKTSGRIITVFGCGGDRDKGKRPMMAKVAVQYSDLVVVTSDNPRTEDPQAIINDIMDGIPKDLFGKKVFVRLERRSGIARALELAQRGDAVLIAGKGHEDYQILGTRKVPFDDVKVVRELLGEI